MPTLFDNVYHPVYALLLMTAVTALAWMASYAVPFFRRELAIEDRSRLTPLDGLRGLLCFAVMFHHAVVTYDYLQTGVWTVPQAHLYALFGSTAVAFFFCVTAFLFWTRVIAQNGVLPPWPFLRARIFRVLPLYGLACVVVLALVARDVHWLSFSALRGLTSMGLMGLRPWSLVGGVEVKTVNAGVTWSLQYEWGFYLFLPALALIVRHDGSKRLWFLALGVAVMFGAGPAIFFLPGILAAHARRVPALVQRLRGVYASAGVVVAAITFPFLTGDGYGAPAFLFTTLIFVPIACGNSVFGLLTLRGLRLMGVVSYSVYLLHGVSLYLAQPALARVQQQGGHVAAHFWLYVLCCAALTLVVSMATYRFVEWPFIRMEKRLRRGPATEAIVKHAAATAG